MGSVGLIGIWELNDSQLVIMIVDSCPSYSWKVIVSKKKADLPNNGTVTMNKCNVNASYAGGPLH